MYFTITLYSFTSRSNVVVLLLKSSNTSPSTAKSVSLGSAYDLVTLITYVAVSPDSAVTKTTI